MLKKKLKEDFNVRKMTYFVSDPPIGEWLAGLDGVLATPSSGGYALEVLPKFASQATRVFDALVQANLISSGSAGKQDMTGKAIPAPGIGKSVDDIRVTKEEDTFMEMLKLAGLKKQIE